MPPAPKMTIATQLVLRALAADPASELYGSEIGDAPSTSGTVHPILRLEAATWVQSRWEDVDPASAGRPARRYYRLTEAWRRTCSARRARARARWSLPARLLARSPGCHERGQRQRPGRLRGPQGARVLVRTATHAVPPGALRDRYRSEHLAELYALPGDDQNRYAVGALTSSWRRSAVPFSRSGT